MDDESVTVQDKLERYLSSRKTPVNVNWLAQRFMVSPRTIRKSLANISGLIVVIIGQTHWYRKK